jgi:hypothetical protein
MVGEELLRQEIPPPAIASFQLKVQLVMVGEELLQ